MKEQLRKEILCEMEPYLDKDMLNKLSGVLISKLQNYQVDIYKNELIICDNFNISMKKLFLASMRMEGKSPNTIAQYNRAIEHLFSIIEKDIRKMNTNDIRYHLATYQQNKNVSNVTMDNERRFISSFFAWLTTEEYIEKNPMLRIKKIRREQTVKRPFSDNDLEKIRESLDNDRDRALIEFLLSTGCRVSEVSNLNINDIDYNSHECIVLGKGNKERTVYISDRSMYYLEKYLSKRTDNSVALFLNKKHGRLSKCSIEMLCREISKKSNVSNVYPHRFRRTFATNALNRGMPVQHVQLILGHSSLDTTMIYCNINKNDIKFEHQKIA